MRPVIAVHDDESPLCATTSLGDGRLVIFARRLDRALREMIDHHLSLLVVGARATRKTTASEQGAKACARRVTHLDDDVVVGVLLPAPGPSRSPSTRNDPRADSRPLDRKTSCSRYHDIDKVGTPRCG
jgi:hypothetical protein